MSRQLRRPVRSVATRCSTNYGRRSTTSSSTSWGRSSTTSGCRRTTSAGGSTISCTRPSPQERAPLSAADKAQLIQDVSDDILGYGPIDRLLKDDEISEVMCNGPADVYIERAGKLEKTSASFVDETHLRRIIDKIVGEVGRRIDEANPLCDARLPDGSRVNAVIHPLAIGGPFLTIRKFAKEKLQVDDLIRYGTLNAHAARFLQACVVGRLNAVVSGGTGTGKTTTLNVLSSFIPSDERIVTVEDAKELQMHQDHVLSMEARPPNIEGRGEVTIRDLVKNCLRMRPDRVVVGECRGGEALDMLQAMNTGHDGSITTVHSNSPRDTLARLETLVLMAGLRPAGAGDPGADGLGARSSSSTSPACGTARAASPTSPRCRAWRVTSSPCRTSSCSTSAWASTSTAASRVT